MPKFIDDRPWYGGPDGPWAGGKIAFGQPNQDTESFPITVYSDSGFATSLGSEVLLDDDGRPSQQIWVPDSRYSYIVRDVSGNLRLSVPDSGQLGTFATSLADLQASSPVHGQIAITAGYSVEGVGGGTYVFSSTNSEADNGGTVIALDSGDGRWLLQHSGRVTVDQFGALGDGVTKDTARIKAAISWASETVGAEVGFTPGRKYLIDETLIVSESNVVLAGCGAGGGFMNSKQLQRDNACSTILWDSATTGDVMIKFTSNPDDDGTGTVKSGGGLRGLFIDGAEVATRGVEIRSWQNGLFEDVFVEACTDRLWYTDVLDNGVASGTAATQHCWFVRCHARVKNLSGNTAIGFLLGGDDIGGPGNTSYCYFYFCRSEMFDGDSFVFANTDNCKLVDSKITVQGTGNGVVFHADDTGPDAPSRNTHSRFNEVRGCEIDAPVVAKATVAGSDSSYGNEIYYSASNNAPEATVEDGAKLYESRNGGATNSGTNAGQVLTGRQVWGARVSRSSSQSIPDAATTAINWTDEDYDDKGIVDLGTDNTALTVPNGIYAVELGFGIEFEANANGYRWARIEVDTGSGWGEFADGVRDTAPTNVAGITTTLHGYTGPIHVTPGDKFRVRVFHNVGGATAINVISGDYTYFMMKLL